MSELYMLILTGIVRILSGLFILKRKEEVKQGFIIKVLLTSFIYSTLLLIFSVPLFRPVLLGIGLLLGDVFDETIIINTFAAIYILGYLFGMLAVEYYNNRKCLQGYYSNKLILRTTLKSHVLSFVIIAVYFMIG